MTEDEWLAGTDFHGMIVHVHSQRMMRKLRLFACACCRRLKRLPATNRALAAVELAEGFADGLADRESMIDASGEAWAAARWTRDAARAANVAAAGASGSHEEASDISGVANAASKEEGPYEPQRAAQVGLLRDVFGNPFRDVAFDDAWRTGDVVSLATAAYEDRILPRGELDPERLTVLADALEEVGAAPEVVAHLRGGGPHVRGCWVVDLCMGRG